MDAHLTPRIVLEAPNCCIELLADTDACARLGKLDNNTIVYSGENTSRYHARIERYHNDFFLIDESTNGTYLQTEDEKVAYLHRDRIRLWGEGWIGLGAPVHACTPIHFRHID